MTNPPQPANAQDQSLVRASLKTPRSAAISGIIFSVIITISFFILYTTLPVDRRNSVSWPPASKERISIALNLIPFAGIAFLWFLGVLRDRLGAMEDRLFATVFLGSGLLFIGMIFIAAAAMGGLIQAHSADPSNIPALIFGRAFAYDVMRIYVFKMVAAFMATTSTVVLRTGIAKRWVSFLGYAGAFFLITASNYVDWSLFLFPLWVFLLSISILI
jgi:hypothetical protein